MRNEIFQGNILMIGGNWNLLAALEQRIKSDANVNIHRVDSYWPAMDYVSRFSHSLILIDLAFGGTETVYKFRRISTAPILTLSATATGIEELASLDAGADYYVDVKKDLGIDRCVAYVKGILQRAFFQRQENFLPHLDATHPLKVNPHTRKAYVDGRDLRLTPTEFIILKALIDHAGEVTTKEQLYQEVWKSQFDINSDAALKNHIMELRKKLKVYDLDGLIETAWGIGYLIHFPPG